MAPRIFESGSEEQGKIQSSTKKFLIIDPCYLTDLEYPDYMNYVTDTLKGVIFETAYGDGAYPAEDINGEIVIDTHKKGAIGVDSGTLCVVPLTAKVKALKKYRKLEHFGEVVQFPVKRIEYDYDGDGRMYLRST